MPITVRSIHIQMDVYPTMMQDTPAGQAEVQAIREFICDVEAAAEKRLPNGRHALRIEEKRTRQTA